MERALAERLTVALAELDVVHVQLNEAMHGRRTANFYRLVSTRPLSERAVQTADVIALSGGSVLIQWRDPCSWAVYESVNAARLTYASAFRLELDDTSERVVKSHDTILEGPLSTADRNVLRLMRLGLSNKEIAVRLGLSASTIKARNSQIFQKLHVLDRFGAVVLTIDWNLDDNQQEDRD